MACHDEIAAIGLGCGFRAEYDVSVRANSSWI